MIAGLYLLLAGRLVYLQAARHTYFQKEAEAYRVSQHILPALRGQILDRNGNVLAMDDTSAWAIYADPLEVKDPAATAQALAPLLGLDAARLQTLLTPALRPGPLRPCSSGTCATPVGNSRPGAELAGHRRRRRHAPHLPQRRSGRPGARLHGQRRRGHRGHRAQPGRPAARPGRLWPSPRWTARAASSPGTERPGRAPENGHDLVLTIDKDLQNVADTEVAQAVKAHHARNGVAIVLDPQTGEILALANAPGYDPNTPRPPGSWTTPRPPRWRPAAATTPCPTCTSRGPR